MVNWIDVKQRNIKEMLVKKVAYSDSPSYDYPAYGQQ